MLNRCKTEFKITPEIEREYLDAAQHVMKKHQIQVNDLHALVLPELERLSPAPFTDAAYGKMARQVAEVITSAIQSRASDDHAALEPANVPSDREQADENPKHLSILSGQSNMRRESVVAFQDAVEQAYGKEHVILATYNRNSQPICMWCKQWCLPEEEEITEKLQKAIEVHPKGTYYLTLPQHLPLRHGDF
ncbi:hypothetical protein [Lignipirellula cremea]|nr:hypothetical protein [Lignipirellula cremea]